MLYIDINCYVSEILHAQLPCYIRCLSVIKNKLDNPELICRRTQTKKDELNSVNNNVILHFVDRASCNDSWLMTNVMHKLFSMYLFLFITLYMFRAHSAHNQERQIVSIQPLVTVILCWWSRCVQVGRRVFFQPAHISANNIEWLLPEAVLKQFVSPDDEHCVLETCRML